MVLCGISLNVCYAKENALWDDYLQDATQVNSPIEYMGAYNKYSAINPNLKIMLRDFCDINKTKNINYTLKNMVSKS